uniref:SHSP domain-containing protein n=1 Tax=Kalanchoe fedtschenkoi TaxID=63787 RepID=A0A7N0SWX9_KALFE
MELAKDSTSIQQIYDDFEPYCKWERYESQDVLNIHVPDFKKNELRIQLSKHGLLTISGQTHPTNDTSKISRFSKRIKISTDDYKEDEIHAKFISGILYITMPKKDASSKTDDQVKNHTHDAANKMKEDVINMEMPPLEDVDEVREPLKKQERRDKQPVGGTMCQEMGYGFGPITGLISDGQKGKKAAMAASLVAVSSLGAYVLYKLIYQKKKKKTEATAAPAIRNKYPAPLNLTELDVSGAGAGAGKASPTTFITSFCLNSLQWVPRPQIYHFFPGVAKVMTSCPVVRTPFPGTVHVWKSCWSTLNTLWFSGW